MILNLLPTCPSCGDQAYVDAEFCEACGGHLSGDLDEAFERVDVDDGRAGAVSDPGLVRRRNEDAVFVAAVDGGSVAVVCDGVSTSVAPHIAARVAARFIGEALVDQLRFHDAAGPPDALRRAVLGADEAIRALPWLSATERTGPACTVVAAIWDGETLAIASAGDSRAYWTSATEGHLVTADDSWAQEQVAAGRLTEEAAMADRRSHTITRWLGDSGLDVDGQISDPALFVVRPSAPGRLVLCSDGLWNHLESESELTELVAANGDAEPIMVARALLDTALSRGGTDNVTIAVLQIDPITEEAS